MFFLSSRGICTRISLPGRRRREEEQEGDLETMEEKRWFPPIFFFDILSCLYEVILIRYTG